MPNVEANVEIVLFALLSNCDRANEANFVSMLYLQHDDVVVVVVSQYRFAAIYKKIYVYFF